VRLAVISVILACAALIAAPGALADGDPASDALVSLPYFDPIDLSIPASTSAQLEAVLSASARAGFPIRVAMIASSTDLGTVSSLWERPRTYAPYLQAELKDLYAGQVLVVMPDGFGLAGPVSGPNELSRAELKVKALAPGSGVKLADAALSAVPLLAAAAGHPIAPSELTAAEHSHAVAVRSTGKALSTSALLTLLLGTLLMALCWRASLSRRPLSLLSRAET
jgi:hypothetical protein